MPTKTKEVATEQADLMEAMRNAERVNDPSSTQKGDMIQGDGNTPLSAVSAVSGAGHLKVYAINTQDGKKDGDVSIINANMLPTQLKKRRDSGELAFTALDPGVRPLSGELKCRLHPDDNERETFDEMGLATCHKANIRNKYELNRHMQHRHKQEWGAIEDLMKQKERDEDREFQRALMSSRTGSPAGATHG